MDIKTLLNLDLDQMLQWMEENKYNYGLIPIDTKPLAGTITPVITGAMKAQCNGEHVVKVLHVCDCSGGITDCEHCDGEGSYTTNDAVDWTTSKAIYQQMASVALANENTPNPEGK